MKYDMYFYQPCSNCSGNPEVVCLNHQDDIRFIPANIASHYNSLSPVDKYKFIQTLLDLDFPE